MGLLAPLRNESSDVTWLGCPFEVLKTQTVVAFFDVETTSVPYIESEGRGKYQSDTRGFDLRFTEVL